jgi:serine/threonine protein kinase
MTRPRPGTPTVEHALIDEFAEAFRRGDGSDPEAWLRARNSGDSSGVAALRAVDLLIRHGNTLGRSRTSTSRDDPTSDRDLSPEPRGPAMSAPSALGNGRPRTLTEDREWLRENQLEMLGFLDVEGGGMGVVALAWHTGMKREVILKAARESYFEERFRREIEVHAKLGGHANIAVVRTSLLYQGMSVLVVDYVAGPNLRRRVRTVGRLQWRDACDCIRQAACGLRHAHAMGVIHRDVKSSNLVRSDRDGVVSVIDWGLAYDHETPAHREAGLTRAGRLLGTPAYCAPEQAARASAATAASDLYGLGCAWYELITGRPPFHGNEAELAHAHAHTPVPPLPAELDVPEAVEHVLRKVLDKNPDRRHRSAEEFIAALDGALHEHGEPLGAPSSSRRWFLTAAALALMFGAWRYWHREPPLPVAPDLVVELTDTSAHPTRSGNLGVKTFEVREGDQVALHAQLPAPYYSYLLSFRPDGAMDLCMPVKDTELPTRTSSVSTPLGNHMIDLNDGAGLQVFALVASRDALPDFRSWRAQQGRPPWEKSTAADPGVVWCFDGTRIKTLPEADETQRGTGGRPQGARGAIGELVQWLESRQGVDLVILKAFAVQPAQP